jgi:pimeloyl-ACP methyl ester carboxylesterase
MTTWVLLRGLMRETRHWGDFPASFLAQLPAQDIVMLDFPGNGSLHATPSLTSVETMVEHCRTFLKTSQYPPPYRILALSLGAMVAASWAERYPNELDKVVLINTSLAPHNPFYLRLRPTNYFLLCRHLLLGAADQREALILRITSNQAGVDTADKTLKRWLDYAKEYPISRKNILRQLGAAMRFRAADSAPAVPVLLMASQQDKLVNAKCSLILAKKWHCEIKIHPTAGHDLPLDDGAWVISVIKEWLLMFPSEFPRQSSD